MLRVNRVGERRRPGIGFFILLVLLLLPRTAVVLLFMFQKAYAPLRRSLSDLVEAIAEPWRDLDGHPAAEVPLSTAEPYWDPCSLLRPCFLPLKLTRFGDHTHSEPAAV